MEDMGVQQFIGQVTLGDILTICTLVGIAVAFGQRLGRFEQILHDHAKKLTEHGERLDRYESRLVDIVSDLQRVIGRVEGAQNRAEQRR
jgi:hypothetical protein